MKPRIAPALVLLVAALSGCGQEYLDGTYGRQRSSGTAGSVNGTDVLAAMFEDAGHEVYTRRTLVTGDMEAADVVVWFPDDMRAPRQEVCEWFDQWLADAPGRTLILVGRDFDAEPQYWEFHNRIPTESTAKKSGNEAARPSSPQPAAEAEPRTKARRDGAKRGDDDSEDEPSSECRWFRYEPGEKVTVRELFGPWAEGIAAPKTRIEVQTRLVPKGDYEILLDSEIGPLVTRLAPPYADGSQIILVENGSFLLNLPLINHQHRLLAGELVAAAGEGDAVVFLESRPGGPDIDPPPTDSSLWTLFQGWPLGAILLQLGIAGVLFCFARWPIFGRPRQPAAASTTDFSYHVAAVGELLQKSRDPSLSAPVEPPSPARQATTGPRSSSSMSR